MRLLRLTTHPDVPNGSQNILHRLATRAIVLKGEEILLLYTERYHDYSLPGGGVDAGESLESAMMRELQEETGAQNIRNIKPYGLYEEFRPWYKDGCDVMHMESYCYTCEIDDELAKPNLEQYEINNGMVAKWINIHQAIKHNEQTIKHSAKKGLSIERETFLLKQIVTELLVAGAVSN
ncbi:DNA mismatch repair protein MutT [Saccharobesus litoralis]|uniref:DNA mismatch repair protein MutT n=1 Tax=Saccharobesus litoralis TaxID=2172099 RepID=A0A2S0VN28_9ALTE|nr:NUDIX hydrolase [Saccharobesus litoralis]AWB65490.1 DNA mismatch repair protein MutT [Saccharobesus litoralis]